jgi:hypothetical protein
MAERHAAVHASNGLGTHGVRRAGVEHDPPVPQPFVNRPPTEVGAAKAKETPGISGHGIASKQGRRA